MKARWTRIVRVATWLLAVVGAFLVPPPAATVEETNRTAAFVVFVVAVAYAAIYRGYQRRLQLLSTGVRTGAVVFALLTATTGFLTYDALLSRWTAIGSDDRTRLVVGASLKPEVVALLREAGVPLENRNEILRRAQNTVAEAWDVTAVPRRQLTLNLLYIVGALAAAFCVLIAVDAPGATATPRARRAN